MPVVKGRVAPRYNLGALRISDIALFFALATQFCYLTGGGALDVNLSRATFLIYCLAALAFDVLPLVRAGRRVFSMVFIWSLGFWAFAFASMLWSPNISAALNPTYINNAIRIIALSFFIPCRFANEGDLRTFLHLFVYVCLYISIAVVVKTPAAQWGTERIGNAIGMNQNSLGILLAYGAFIASYCYLYYRESWALLPLMPFTSIALLTGSRKAFILICVLLFSLLVLRSKGVKKGFSVLLGISAVAALFYFVMNNPDLYRVLGARIEQTIIDDGASLDRMRELYRQFGWNLFLQRPIFGFGIGGFKIMVPSAVVFSTDVAYSHCNYIELLSCFGLVGFCLFYSLYIWIFVNLCRGLRQDRSLSVLGIPIILTLLMTDYGNVSYPELGNLIVLLIPYLAIRASKRQGKREYGVGI